MARLLFASCVLAGLLFAADFELGKQAFEKGDYATALKEWQPLAEEGLPFAAYNVGLLYAKGQGVKADPVQAAKWYRIAAEKGIPEAQYNLGVLYSTGTGLAKDETEASKWFAKAAEKGDANAANSIGTLYDSGEGSLHNLTEAEKWYRKGAEEGNSDAQFNLGVMYDTGHGVKTDFAEAEKWYRKAADQWNEGALCNIAILYYNGDGVRRDLVQAHAYYLLAKEAGDPRAANLIQLTTEKLNKKQIAEAVQIAEKFKQDHAHQIAAANAPATKPPSPDSVGPEVATAYSKPVSAAAPGVWAGVERVVAIGDLHGDYEQLIALLQSAGLVDTAANWVGRSAHLVQTGDVVDEGPDSRRIMDLLMKLETQAKASGGMVHCLIGNHEAMDMYGDLRFVSPAGYQEYTDTNSSATRDRAYDVYAKGRQNVTAKADWMMLHPPGFFEQRNAFSADGKYGKWILTHDTAIRVNDTLYSHAGIGPKYANYSLEELNRAVRDELAHPGAVTGGIITDLQGPLWYSGFSMSAEAADLSLDATLKKFGALRQVVGHTDAGPAITPRFKNRVVLIDVGLTRGGKNGGRQACLLEEKGQLYALHRGARLTLPKDESGDLLRYWKQAAALEPEPSALAGRILLLEPK